MPDSSDRQRLIKERIKSAEDRAIMSLAVIRDGVKDFLITEKGYSESDIEFDREFEVIVDGKGILTSVDYIIKLNDTRFMAIKCSPGSLESRERHIVSFARVVDSHQIPFAVVTDGSQARILNTVSGKLISEGLDSIPYRSQALEIIKSVEFIPYPQERLDREKRILLAFDVIKCTEELCE
ncbi:MAG: type I restriction enzyme HsdR N-terminal domain-containing protein [Thermodesulfovibrionales bacterium]